MTELQKCVLLLLLTPNVELYFDNDLQIFHAACVLVDLHLSLQLTKEI